MIRFRASKTMTGRSPGRMKDDPRVEGLFALPNPGLKYHYEFDCKSSDAIETHLSSC